MIAIFDYGAGNLRSVENTLDEIGAYVHTGAGCRGAAQCLEDHSAGRRPFRADDARARRDAGARTRLSSASARACRFSGSVWDCRRSSTSSEEAPEERGLGIFRGHGAPLSDRRPRAAHGLERSTIACAFAIARAPGCPTVRLFRAQLLRAGRRQTAATCTYTCPTLPCWKRATFSACSSIPRIRSAGVTDRQNFVEL